LKGVLAENESLFVEHKTDIAKGEGYQLAKAAASFANTLGGWILVGVNDKGPVPGWKPPSGGFVDAVRQRLEGQIDPVPSFAAGVLPHGDHSIGVIRVYESTDTPHILSKDGSIVVREPAQDTKLRKRGRYEATPIRSHYELVQLTQRGAQAENAAQERLDKGRMPWIEKSLRYHWTQAASEAGIHEIATGETPALVLRGSPLTMSARWREWGTSESAVEALVKVIGATLDGEIEIDEPQPHPAGVSLTARERDAQVWTPGGHRYVTRVATAVIDSGGALGVRLGFRLEKRGGKVYDWRALGAGEGLEALLKPLIGQLSDVLLGAEHLGRFNMHLLWLGIGEIFRVAPENEGEGSPPPYLPCGGTLTIDGQSDATEQRALARQWSQELLRASGIAVWDNR
jgi:hypothetical protein